MRTLVEIPEKDLQALDGLAGRRKKSRAALIRHAVSDYLSKHGGAGESAFGVWKGKIDGLKHQRKLRDEW